MTQTKDFFETFSGLTHRDLIQQAWLKDKAPALTKLIQKFNKLSYWVEKELKDVKVG